MHILMTGLLVLLQFQSAGELEDRVVRRLVQQGIVSTLSLDRDTIVRSQEKNLFVTWELQDSQGRPLNTVLKGDRPLFWIESSDGRRLWTSEGEEADLYEKGTGLYHSSSWIFRARVPLQISSVRSMAPGIYRFHARLRSAPGIRNFLAFRVK